MKCKVIDNDNHLLGNVLDSGSVFTNKDFLGYLIPQNGKIFDNKDNYLGYIDKNGSIYNPCDIKVGQIKENGFVYDSNQKLTGRVVCDSKEHAAAGTLMLILDNKFELCHNR